MLQFIAHYKKVIGLSVIPFLLVLAFFGYQMVQGQSNDSVDLTVNEGMQALLNAAHQPTPKATPSNLELAAASELPLESTIPKPAASPETNIKPETTAKPKANSSSKTADDLNDKININQATKEELVKLSGIGESKAKAIIAYREQVQGFKALDELMKVKGIGVKIFEKIKSQLEL